MKSRLVFCTILMVMTTLIHERASADQDEFILRYPKPAAFPGGSLSGGERIVFMDERRGVPTMVLFAPDSAAHAVGATARTAARNHLNRHASIFGLSATDRASAYISHVHDTGRGGVVVSFRQQVAGMEVLRNRMAVLLTRDLRLVAMTGNLYAGAQAQKRAHALTPAQAMARACSDVGGRRIDETVVLDTGERRDGYSHHQLRSHTGLESAGLRLSEAARVKPVWYPLPERLVPAYYVEMFLERGQRDVAAHGYVIAADDGRVLTHRHLTQHDTFQYRVWTHDDALQTPGDGPESDYTPHPTGIPFTVTPDYVPSNLVTMDGFNSNPVGQPDSWLPANATETTGNNADAYADISGGDGFDAQDVRADTNIIGGFDHTYDLQANPMANMSQRKAAVTQLFYTVNWLHNYYYDSGFNEAAGNAQTDNYDRGGIGGDALEAQAQDFLGFNNASMSTPADGASPRMQIHVWKGPIRGVVTAQSDIYQGYGAEAMGPQVFDVAGPLALADDGVGVGIDACEPLSVPLVGAIALTEYGTCPVAQKLGHLQDGGALAALLVHDTPGLGPAPLEDVAPSITIPVLSLSHEDGQALINALASGAILAGMERTPAVVRDGALDNGLVAHEWGHYLHRRLTDCDTHQCNAQSEGWADLIALMLIVREGDDLDGGYAVAGYATPFLGDAAYFGIRRVPYSRNPAVNAFTFKHVGESVALPPTPPWRFNYQPNSEVHNAGEVWANALFTGYAALLEQSTGPDPTSSYEQVKRRMADYVVAGMMLAPVDATFNEQLEAFLLAAAVQDENDHELLRHAFASRGFGRCSQSPDRGSLSLDGVVEDFDVHGAVELVGATVDDTIDSCDDDGFLDLHETGRLTVSVYNAGAGPLEATSIEVTTTSGAVQFPDGRMASIAGIMPGESASVTIPIQFVGNGGDTRSIELGLSATTADSCLGPISATWPVAVHLDSTEATLDTVENPTTTWTPGGSQPMHWQRRPVATGHVWFASNLQSTSDTYLESAPIEVSMQEDFSLSFTSRYRLHQEGSAAGDGGVIEVSTDGGASWQDISLYTQETGYNGIVATGTDNPLAGRNAYTGSSPSWPEPHVHVLELGSSLAGQTVRVRFRLGTDQAHSDHGWEIDNIAVIGAVNAPFLDVEEDAGNCSQPPVAEAGPEQTVESGGLVTLDGSASYDPGNDPLTFQWQQLGGPSVQLLEPERRATTFVAPQVSEPVTLTFQLTVDNGRDAASDTVAIHLRAGSAADGGVPDAMTHEPPTGGCCQGSSGLGGNQVLLFFLSLIGLSVHNRRRVHRPS